MNGLVRNFLELSASTTLAGSARLTNFNPDRILFVVSGSTAVKRADLEKIRITLNFKNSVGSGISIANGLPLDIVADLTDYLYGFGLLGSDIKACLCLDIGKYILKADDDITLNVSGSGLSEALGFYCFAMDSHVGKEQLISWKFVETSATQAYQESGIMEVYAKIPAPLPDVYLTIDDFYGSNNISQLAVVGMGSALGSSEDFDSFGILFHDPTGLTQPVTVRSSTGGERLLFKQWNFDKNRLGFASQDYANVNLLSESIRVTNPSKYDVLSDYYGD